MAKSNLLTNIIKIIEKKEVLNYIKKYNFNCVSCGKCCQYQPKKDNTVYIRYDEIINITKIQNINFYFIVDPYFPDVIKFIHQKNIYLGIKKYFKLIKEQID